MVSSTPWPHFTPGEDPVPILQGAGWSPGPIWMGGKSRSHRDSIHSQSLYRLSYLAHPRCTKGSSKLSLADYLTMAQDVVKVNMKYCFNKSNGIISLISDTFIAYDHWNS